VNAEVNYANDRPALGTVGTQHRLNLYSSTRPVRLAAWLIGFLVAVISVIILVAEAVVALMTGGTVSRRGRIDTTAQ
jgi:hypothetical protein